MKAYLTKRKTNNALCKITSVKTKEVDGKKAICFYSSYDECGYIYPGYDLYEAVKAYEKDTKYQGFEEITFMTYDVELAEELGNLPPF